MPRYRCADSEIALALSRRSFLFDPVIVFSALVTCRAAPGPHKPSDKKNNAENYCNPEYRQDYGHARSQAGTFVDDMCRDMGASNERNGGPDQCHAGFFKALLHFHYHHLHSATTKTMRKVKARFM